MKVPGRLVSVGGTGTRIRRFRGRFVEIEGAARWRAPIPAFPSSRSPTMSPLRHRMIEDMQVRNLSSYTQRNYLYAIARLARHFAVSPAGLGREEVRAA